MASELYVGGTYINSTSIKIGDMTTAVRDAGVGTDTGTLIYNSTNGRVEVYTANGWEALNSNGQISATGGTTSTVDGYTVHTFTSSGTFTVTSGYGEAEVLVVAGGGGAGGGTTGCHAGGGGGGGGVVYTKVLLVNGDYPVQVGSGGAGAPTRTNGGDSYFGTITANGGGAGGPTLTGNANTGGSGGGSSRDNNSNQGGDGNQPLSADGGFGNDGGDTGPSNTSPGGGGGAGGPGLNGNNGGIAGPGLQFTMFGDSIYYGAGGCGSGSTESTEGRTPRATNGAANTGAGGGGDSVGTANHGDGGSGIVKVRYKIV